MAGFSILSPLPYKEQLRLAALDDVLTRNIDKSTRSIIGSVEDLKETGLVSTVQAVDSSSERITDGIGQLRRAADEHHEEVKFSLDGIRKATEGVGSEVRNLKLAFDWAMEDLQFTLGRMGDTLNALLETARTPTRNWAREQYDIAIEAYRKHSFDEALRSVTYALEGHHGNLGYRLDWRFHHFLGSIRLGDVANNSPDIVDPARAEQAFLSAAKLALPDEVPAAARAFLSAGRAAYVQVKLETAVAHTSEALRLMPDLPAGLMQMARLKIETGTIEEGYETLYAALTRDPSVAAVLTAATDAMFRRHGRRLRGVMSKVRDDLLAAVDRLQSGLKDTEGELRRHSALRRKPEAAADVFANSERDLALLDRSLQQGTIRSLLRGRDLAHEVERELPHVRARLDALQQEIVRAEAEAVARAEAIRRRDAEESVRRIRRREEAAINLRQQLRILMLKGCIPLVFLLPTILNNPRL